MSQVVKSEAARIAVRQNSCLYGCRTEIIFDQHVCSPRFLLIQPETGKNPGAWLWI